MKSVHNLNVPLNKCKSLSGYKIDQNHFLPNKTKADILHKKSAGGRMSGMSGFEGSSIRDQEGSDMWSSKQNQKKTWLLLI